MTENSGAPADKLLVSQLRDIQEIVPYGDTMGFEELCEFVENLMNAGWQPPKGEGK